VKVVLCDANCQFVMQRDFREALFTTTTDFLTNLLRFVTLGQPMMKAIAVLPREEAMKVALVLVLGALSACAQDPSAISAALAACGPKGVRFDVRSNNGQHPAPNPEPGKALVYVVEDQRKDLKACIGNCGVITKLALDGTWIGANRGSSYFSFFVGPGEHHLCAAWEKGAERPQDRASLASFTAEPGHIYYFRVRATVITAIGLLFYSLDLEPMNQDEGQLLVAASPLSTFDQKK